MDSTSMDNLKTYPRWQNMGQSYNDDHDASSFAASCGRLYQRRWCKLSCWVCAIQCTRHVAMSVEITASIQQHTRTYGARLYCLSRTVFYHRKGMSGFNPFSSEPYTWTGTACTRSGIWWAAYLCESLSGLYRTSRTVSHISIQLTMLWVRAWWVTYQHITLS